MDNKPFRFNEEFILNPELEDTDIINPLNQRLNRIKVIGVMLGWKPDDYAIDKDLADIGWMLDQLVIKVKELTDRMQSALLENNREAAKYIAPLRRGFYYNVDDCLRSNADVTDNLLYDLYIEQISR